jgi:protoporphyrinogen oxidase
VGLDPVARRARFADGTEVGYERLISSVPLPELIPTIDGAPADVVAAATRLSFTTVVLVNLGVDRADLSDAHITYVYDEDIVFSRVSFPRLLSPETVPPGHGAIQAEVYFSDRYRPLTVSPDSLIEPVIADLRRMGTLLETDSVVASEARVVRFGNVIYDHDRGPAVRLIHDYLDEVGIHYCGRYGDWNHEWTDEAFLSGEAAAHAALERLGR